MMIESRELHQSDFIFRYFPRYCMQSSCGLTTRDSLKSAVSSHHPWVPWYIFSKKGEIRDDVLKNCWEIRSLEWLQWSLANFKE